MRIGEENGEKPNSGTITFINGKIDEVSLDYGNKTIVKNNDGDLEYEVKLKPDAYFVDGTYKDWETLKAEGKVTDTTIVNSAFVDDTTLVKFVIKDGVETIGEDTFVVGNYSEVSSKLELVLIPDSVTKIGYGAFSNCYSLTSIAIPNSVVDINPYAFQNCTNLTVYYSGSTPEPPWTTINLSITLKPYSQAPAKLLP